MIWIFFPHWTDNWICSYDLTNSYTLGIYLTPISMNYRCPVIHVVRKSYSNIITSLINLTLLLSQFTFDILSIKNIIIIQLIYSERN